MKPVIYSAIASIISGLKNRVYAFAGLGFIFSSKRKSAKILRPILKLILKFLLKGINTRLILQNRDDAFDILNSKLISKKNIKLIRGSGVDTTNYSFSTIPNDVPLVILPARMLWDKGIGEFVESAIILKRKGFNVRLVLVGTPDEHNPESINETQLEIWKNEEIIEWWGHQNNMVKVYHQSTIVCLPSYREGLPKSLLEAASCGRPIVAYDVPGCREIVKDGYNGYLVQPKSIDGLVEAIILLINNYKLCVQMGKNGRKLVEKHFTQEKIARETIAVWEEVLAC
jgi:glycosyltransferase involved in cell wall biosynthesis